MSYEGYVQKLCANGHLRSYDYYDDEAENVCSCGAAFVFRHDVDETNCEGVHYPFVVATPAETQICNLGHVHITREQTYVIPSSAQENIHE